MFALSGENQENGYAVYKIRETAFGGGTKLSAEDGFLQFMIERLLSSSAAVETEEDEDADESGDNMKLTSLQSISDFMTCAGRTLPDNIRSVGKKKSGCSTFPGGISGRKTSCTACFIHYDECAVEEQLF